MKSREIPIMPMGFLNPMFVGFHSNPRISILDFPLNQKRDWSGIQIQIPQTKRVLRVIALRSSYKYTVNDIKQDRSKCYNPNPSFVHV